MAFVDPFNVSTYPSIIAGEGVYTLKRDGDEETRFVECHLKKGWRGSANKWNAFESDVPDPSVAVFGVVIAVRLIKVELEARSKTNDQTTSRS